MLKSLKPTAELSLNKLIKRLLLLPLDSNKWEAERLYRANIKLNKISFSFISVK